MTFSKDFLDLSRCSKEEIHELLDLAAAYRDGQQPTALKRDVTVANLFFENSTRTVTSFQMAEHRLGLSRFNINPQTSSMKKGESMGDTLKTLQAIGLDLAVIRHSQTAWYKQLEKDPKLAISLINAGDGAGLHPSQTLLDLLTIRTEFGHFEGLKIVIAGDIAHSRVAKSDARLFKELGMQVYFAGPEEWWEDDLAEFGEFLPLDDCLAKVDVVICLRVQLERLNDQSVASFAPADYFHQYGLTEERAAKMKPGAIIMHPAPVNRGVEIASDLVDGPRSRIFTQMHNGVFARMALLTKVLQFRGLMEEK
ncbi:aspartate carbamoyltransferase catalytic subunit [Eupransor demetentiae]|uniref:Aspartate carbamoyltransferase n=1 Tax=Eupransor demetentiae TaxID=3109584 RepID=A0ABM9N5U2_9LACO|nr:Aspartate carbamoyltransferase [Lactobacillaceae bacterium LMG 33000]